jgi:hypothetical protein
LCCRQKLLAGERHPNARSIGHDLAMDDIVKQAMAKWPNVPDCYGWLGLDARGNWYLREASAQQQGSFASGAPGAKGSRVQLDKLIAFIGRNYEVDARGCWYFQNGPQRVYLELEAAPWVLRLQLAGQDVLHVHTHTGQAVQVSSCWMDEGGRAYLQTDAGLGLVHTLDTGVLADALEMGLLPEPSSIDQQRVPAQFGFVRSPQALVGEQPAAGPGE